MAKQVTDFYRSFFKVWPKALGNKPTADELATIHALGARAGKQALANAMMLRAEGATASQIVQACGAPQLNKMREFVSRKLVTRDMNVAPSDAGHTVYKINLAAKGKVAVAKAADVAKAAEADGAAKPAKAKRKAKAKAVKVPEASQPEATAPQPEASQPEATS